MDPRAKRSASQHQHERDPASTGRVRDAASVSLHSICPRNPPRHPQLSASEQQVYMYTLRARPFRRCVAVPTPPGVLVIVSSATSSSRPLPSLPFPLPVSISPSAAHYTHLHPAPEPSPPLAPSQVDSDPPRAQGQRWRWRDRAARCRYGDERDRAEL
jgi:hypothetical protein